MTDTNDNDLQVRIRLIENGYIISGRFGPKKIHQKFLPDKAAVLEEIDIIANAYCHAIEEELGKDMSEI